MKVDPKAEREQIERLQAFRASRDSQAVEAAIQALKQTAASGVNIMPASIKAAHAGVTTGEWTTALKEVFGEYRAPTGVRGVSRDVSEDQSALEAVRRSVHAWNEKTGKRLRILVGKPGLDGHSNGAEQIAVRARDVGMEVVYEGIRLTPEQIANSALQEDVHVVGLSILSGSHLELIPDVIAAMRRAGLSDVPVVVGGIIPEEDREPLMKAGVAAVYTPKDFDLNRIMGEIVQLLG